MNLSEVSGKIQRQIRARRFDSEGWGPIQLKNLIRVLSFPWNVLLNEAFLQNIVYTNNDGNVYILLDENQRGTRISSDFSLDRQALGE